MELVQKKTIEHAMKMLDAIGASYAIKDAKGLIYGTLQVTKKRSARALHYPFGTIAAYVRPYIEDLQVGAIAHVPCEQFGRAAISTSVTASLSQRHGKGSFKTAYNKEEKTLEVIRFK